jgi:DNA-binding XRE family transcriptional regulator
VKEWLSGRRPTANVFYRRRELQAAVRLEAASTLRSRMAAAPVLTLIGQTLREMRTVRGMTQQQLADLCEMHRTFIISIEKGRQNASAITLVRLPPLSAFYRPSCSAPSPSTSCARCRSDGPAVTRDDPQWIDP